MDEILEWMGSAFRMRHAEPDERTALESLSQKYIVLSKFISVGAIMPIFIKDPQADMLLKNVLLASGEKSKTKAVLTALRHELERMNAAIPASRRLATIQKDFAALGKSDPKFDMKEFSDEMSGQ
jgi:hypothetical protein